MDMTFVAGKFEGCSARDLPLEDLFWTVLRSRPCALDLDIARAELRRRKDERRLNAIRKRTDSRREF